MEKKQKHQGKSLGDYRIYTKEPLGQGTFGIVFPGIQISTQKPVAIKQINIHENDINNLSDELRTFVLVSKKAEELQIENIVQFYSVMKTSNNIYLVMEKCSKNLCEYIQEKGGSIAEQESLEIMKRILEGYRAIKEAGVAHRDLKLENILFSVENNTPKIGDFGWARKIQDDSTILQTKAGSPAYMSPQILQSLVEQTVANYTWKCDIFSLGIMLYQMVAGNIPWPANSQKSLWNKLKTQPLRVDHLQISEKFKDLLKKMLAFDEMNRIEWNELINNECFHQNKQQSQYILQENDEIFQSIKTSEEKVKIKNEIIKQQENIKIQQGSNSNDSELDNELKVGNVLEQIEEYSIIRNQMEYEKYKMLFLYNIISTYLIKLLKGLEFQETNSFYQTVVFIFSKYMIYKATKFVYFIEQGPRNSEEFVQWNKWKLTQEYNQKKKIYEDTYQQMKLVYNDISRKYQQEENSIFQQNPKLMILLKDSGHLEQKLFSEVFKQIIKELIQSIQDNIHKIQYNQKMLVAALLVAQTKQRLSSVMVPSQNYFFYVSKFYENIKKLSKHELLEKLSMLYND